MNRRTFLKSLAIACGAAVVCPGELLKDEPDPWIRAAALRKKNTAMGTKLILRKQDLRFPCCHPSWPELVEVPIDYQGREWPE